MRDALLGLGAVVGSLCIVTAIVCSLFDVRMLLFRSGSMSPQIPTGAVAFARSTPAADLAVGDVVSVLAGSGTRITHRIQSVTVADGTASLVLKGDANGRADAETYSVTSADRVLFDVPYVGYAIGYATGPVGIFLGGLLVAGLLWLIVRPARGPGGTGGGGRDATSRGDRGAGGRRRATTSSAVLAVAAVGLVVHGPTSTLAYFSDNGTVAAGTFSTHTVVSQAQPTCTDVNGFLVLGNIARLTWVQVNPLYEYSWELRQLNGTVLSSGTVGAGQAAGETVTLNIGTGLIGTNGNLNVAVRARLRAAPSWIAPTETVTQVRRASIIILGVSMRCGHT